MANTHYHLIDKDHPLNPASPVPWWESAQTWLHIRAAKLRLWLRKRGAPLKPTFNDLSATFNAIDAPLREWIWHPGGDPLRQAAVVLKWLDEIVLRAPVVRGLDIQMCSVGLYRPERQQVDYRGVVLDKHSWRKQGRAEIGDWLAQALATTDARELAITVQVFTFSAMLGQYAKMLKA